MTAARRKEKRCHMMMWAILTRPINDYWCWMYLLEWAALGGRPEEVPRG